MVELRELALKLNNTQRINSVTLNMEAAKLALAKAKGSASNMFSGRKESDQLPPSARDEPGSQQQQENTSIFNKAKNMFSSGNSEPAENPAVRNYRERRERIREEEAAVQDNISTRCAQVWGTILMLLSVVGLTIVRSVIRVQDLNFSDVLLVRSLVLVPLVLGLLRCQGITLMPENSKGIVMRG